MHGNMNVMLITFAELPCEKDTLELQFVFIRRLSGIMQTLLSIKSECNQDGVQMIVLN